MATALHRAGFEPVPHIAARRVSSSAELQQFMRRSAIEAQVRRVLIIGGDRDVPAGPYTDAESILADAALAESAIESVDLAVYPVPHPTLSDVQLAEASQRKVTLAGKLGLTPRLITQFCFDPPAIARCVQALEHKFPAVKVVIGVPGPVSWSALIKYARVCGVSLSASRAASLGVNAARLATSDPTSLLVAIAAELRRVGTTNVAGAHVFAFGGLTSAARWMAAYGEAAAGATAPEP